MKTPVALAAATLAAALALPAVASAHVTVNPKEAPAAAFTLLDVRVPNERDSASTVKVEMQLPPGVVAVSYEPTPGWTVKVVKEKLAKPIQTPDGPITEAVSTITWTGDGKGEGQIDPDQFRDFPISLQIPGKPGDVLTFKALQTYSNGEIVRWIGGPNSDEPAPTLTVTADDDSAGAAAHTDTAAAAPATAASDDDSDGSDTLAIAALVVGALALIGAIAALATGRRRGSAA
jgi:periplasmic copper chaperone A